MGSGHTSQQEFGRLCLCFHKVTTPFMSLSLPGVRPTFLTSLFLNQFVLEIIHNCALRKKPETDSRKH